MNSTTFVRNNNDGGSRKKHQHLPAGSFIQRFMSLVLSHVLPQGLKRIRHYGLLANCHKREKLALCRVEQIDIAAGNACRNGRFKVIAVIAPLRHCLPTIVPGLRYSLAILQIHAILSTPGVNVCHFRYFSSHPAAFPF